MSISNKLGGGSEISVDSLPDLIGIGGTFASGKDSLACALVDRFGFTHVSTGDMVRIEAMKRYGNIERPTLTTVAVELRNESGSGVLAKKALELPRPLVVSGIRTAGEVKTLKSAGGVMVFIDAEPGTRFKRMKSRQRDSETKLTFEEFLAREQNEISGAKTDADQNIGAVREMSDLTLDNNGTYEEFIDGAINKLCGVER